MWSEKVSLQRWYLRWDGASKAVDGGRWPGEREESILVRPRWERMMCVLRNMKAVWFEGNESRQECSEMRVKSR